MKTSITVRVPPPALPQEVLLQIVSHLEADHSNDPSYDLQETLWAVGLMNRDWYSSSVAALYWYPRVTSKNYDAFVRTICPSINAHIRKTDLARMVKVLDLSQLVFAGSKSLVARLLGRLKENLEVLRAPQTSFAVNSLAALAKCQRLHTLDLSLVTESIPVLDFFRAIEKLEHLVNLYLPRSNFLPPKEGPNTRAHAWPPNLRFLALPGRLSRILSAHAPEGPLIIQHLHLQEIRGNDDDVDFTNMITQELSRLVISAQVGRELMYAGIVFEALIEHFSSLRYLHLHNFTSLSMVLDVIADNRETGVLNFLEEITISPISNILLEGEDDEEDFDNIIDSLSRGLVPILRRLVLEPSDELTDWIWTKLSALSIILKRHEPQRLKAGGEDYIAEPAGVFFTGPNAVRLNEEFKLQRLTSASLR